IVGRTGSGKSTILNVLFRLMTIDTLPGEGAGRIVLDGLDIGLVPLRDLRNALTIIPQDPFLFNGSVRSNLDPAESLDDSSLWAALDAVGIGERIRSDPAGLDSAVANGGANFAVGERQLLCL